jgi:ABC-type glycerol-3-phosphate transport system permease component
LASARRPELINRRSHQTMRCISMLITQFQTLWGEMMAVSALYLLPVLVVMLLAQRGIVKGLMAGATR